MSLHFHQKLFFDSLSHEQFSDHNDSRNKKVVALKKKKHQTSLET